MDKTFDTKTPQQLEAEGGSAYHVGNHAEAAGFFSAAEEGYRALGDELKAAEMANNCSVAWLQANQVQEAYQAVQDTVDVFRTAQDKKRLAMALGNRAAALEALENLEQALTDYEESADILKEIGEHDLRLDVMKSISALQLRTGRSLQAVATMQAGVDGVEKPNLKHRLLKRILNFPSKFMTK